MYRWWDRERERCAGGTRIYRFTDGVIEIDVQTGGERERCTVSGLERERCTESRDVQTVGQRERCTDDGIETDAQMMR